MVTKNSPEFIEYQGNGIVFDYPVGGAIYEFRHSDGNTTVRLAGTVAGKVVQLDIEKWLYSESAKKACETTYNGSNKLYINESVPPRKVQAGDREGWRCIRRLVDGSNASDYTDTTFLETTNGLYRIELTSNPDVYNKARTILEQVLKTIRVG